MDHSQNDSPEQAQRRQELIAYVAGTVWSGSSVLSLCARCRISALEQFTSALKSGAGPIPLIFRWASDEDMQWVNFDDDVDEA